MSHQFTFGIVLILFSFGMPLVYGHGLGGETLPPVTIGDRNALFSIEISPSTFDPENPEKWVSLRLTDSQDGFELIIEHVTFDLELKKDGQQIFKQMFHDDFGNLNFKVVTTDSETIEIDGIQEQILGGWMRSEYEPLTVTGPIFEKGGLYEYKVEIVTVDSDNNILDPRMELKGAISLAEISSFEVKDSKNNPHEIRIFSYFDSLETFDFKSDEMRLVMPFDWNQDLEQLAVIHEEIRVPNSLEEFLSTKYDLTVNGLPMPDDVVTIDDYSVDERTIHIVLNKELLKQIREKAIIQSDSEVSFVLKTSDEVKLPLQAITPDYRYEVFVSWDPEIIKAGQSTAFYFDINGMFREKEKTGPLEYDLKLIQDEQEIYSNHITGTLNSDLPDEHKIEFESEDIGSVNLILSNIGGNSLAKANFIFVVYPDDRLPDFPLKVTSVYESDGELMEGSYDVDVTWFPSPLELGESEFVLTFYQKDTNIPMKNTDYDFVLIKNGSEIFRKDGNAKAGGTFENYVFSDGDLGDVTVRVENIGGTSEFIEIPVFVTPEFPIVFAIFGISMTVLFVFYQMKYPKIKF